MLNAFFPPVFSSLGICRVSSASDKAKKATEYSPSRSTAELAGAGSVPDFVANAFHAWMGGDALESEGFEIQVEVSARVVPTSDNDPRYIPLLHLARFCLRETQHPYWRLFILPMTHGSMNNCLVFRAATGFEPDTGGYRASGVPLNLW